MQPDSDNYIILRGGLALPLRPLVLLLDLEARGFSIHRDGDDVVIRPAHQLTDEEHEALRRWKHHLLALIDAVEGAQ